MSEDKPLTDLEIVERIEMGRSLMGEIVHIQDMSEQATPITIASHHGSTIHTIEDGETVSFRACTYRENKGGLYWLGVIGYVAGTAPLYISPPKWWNRWFRLYVWKKPNLKHVPTLDDGWWEQA